MSATRMNQFGLRRTIPEDVKLSVRQRSKFGCVICRSAIVNNDHFDPEFADATSHHADGICLLCPTCHAKRGNGLISTENVRKAYTHAQSSNDVRPPIESFLPTGPGLTVTLGEITAQRPQTIFMVDGEPILEASESSDWPFPTLSGLFTNELGEQILRVKDNEYTGTTEQFDFETTGIRIKIRRKRGRISLLIAFDAKTSSVHIERLDMRYGPAHFWIPRRGELWVGRIDVTPSVYVSLGWSQAPRCDTVIDVDSRSSGPRRLNRIRFAGGEGLSLDGLGITLFAGSPTVRYGPTAVSIVPATKIPT